MCPNVMNFVPVFIYSSDSNAAHLVPSTEYIGSGLGWLKRDQCLVMQPVEIVKQARVLFGHSVS